MTAWVQTTHPPYETARLEINLINTILFHIILYASSFLGCDLIPKVQLITVRAPSDDKQSPETLEFAKTFFHRWSRALCVSHVVYPQ